MHRYGDPDIGELLDVTFLPLLAGYHHRCDILLFVCSFLPYDKMAE